MPITRIDALPIHGDLKPDIAIISSLGKHLVGQYVLVKVHDDQGRVGLGEASVTCVWSGETQAGTITLIKDFLSPLLIGADPFDIEWISRKMDKTAHVNSFAKGAIEMALLDLQGQILGQPVYRLLGGKASPEGPVNKEFQGPGELGVPTRDGIRLKFVVGAVEPEVSAQRAKAMVDRGWKAIKVKVGRHPHPQADVDRLQAVREAIGDTWLSVDANGGYTVDQAVWVASRFEKLNIMLFEQPTRRNDHVAMAEVRSRTCIPIMADESVFTPLDAIEVIRHRAADVISLYPGKHGGIRPTQQIAKIAEAAGIPCTIGSNLEREVATAAMAHVVVCTPNLQCEKFPGDLIGPVYFQQTLTTEPLKYKADRVWAPEKPGLGVRMAE